MNPITTEILIALGWCANIILAACGVLVFVAGLMWMRPGTKRRDENIPEGK